MRALTELQRKDVTEQLAAAGMRFAREHWDEQPEPGRYTLVSVDDDYARVDVFVWAAARDGYAGSDGV